MLPALVSPMEKILYDLRLSLSLELLCHTHSVPTRSLVQCLGPDSAGQMLRLKWLVRPLDLAHAQDRLPRISLALCLVVFSDRSDAPP